MTSLPRILLACALLAAPAARAQDRAGQSFNSNGVTISYADSGAGVPVVLVHGFTGSYSRHWERSGVSQALVTAGYRVIAIDCRGHGQSGKPLDSTQYGVEMVRDVVRLLDHLKIDRAHIVGYSMGGAIAQQMVVKYPGRVVTATLLGAGWDGENQQALTANMLAMADGFDRRDASGLIGAVSGADQGGLSEADLAAATADLFARNDPQVLAAIARGLPPLWQISRDELERVAAPMLVITGANDRQNLEGARRMARMVKGAQFVELPGATHQTSVRPSATHIVAFLNQHRR